MADTESHPVSLPMEPMWSRKLLRRIANSPKHQLSRYFFAAATSEILGSGRIPLVPPRHFLFLMSVDPVPFLAEINDLPEPDWYLNDRHTLQVHNETVSLNLATSARPEASDWHNQYLKPTGISKKLPALMAWLEDFAATIGNGTLQTARVVKLRGHGKVHPHVDRGLYYLIRDRYHFVLSSPNGSKMQCEDQVSIWKTGEVWWFNNHVTHQAFNDGDGDRIHVIFDVLPHKNRFLVPYLQKEAKKKKPVASQ